MKELVTKNRPISIALGYFDSVHYAHRKIIDDAISFAKSNGLKSAIFTFSATINNLPSVYTYKERKGLLEEKNIDYIISRSFDGIFKQMNKKDFIDMLLAEYDIRYIVCGYDYRFGCNRAGDVDFLKRYVTEKYPDRNIQIKIFEPIILCGQRVSTTLIKDALSLGNINKANKFLCHPYFIEGRVCKGKGRGKDLVYPTANLKPCVNKILPKFGVYSTRTLWEDKIVPSVTSVGSKPTFGDDSVTVETFLIDERCNLYGKNITVEFLDFIRDIKKFDSTEELKKQITQDVEGLKC